MPSDFFNPPVRRQIRQGETRRNTSLRRFNMARFMVIALSAVLIIGCGASIWESAGIGAVTTAPAVRVDEANEAVELAAPTCLVIQRGGVGNVADATISSAAPDKNFGDTTLISVKNTGGVRDGALLRFDLSAIPRGASITSAKMTLTLVQDGGVRARVHRISSPWAERTVTWNGIHGAFKLVPEATLPGTKTASVELQTLVQGWANGTIENNGVLVEREPSGSNVFASSEGVSSARPSLNVCYQMITTPSCITVASQNCINGLCQEYCTSNGCLSPADPISQAMCECGSAFGLNPACGVGTCAGTRYCPSNSGGCGISICSPSSSPASQMLCGGNIASPSIAQTLNSTVVSNAGTPGGSNRGSGYAQTNTMLRHCGKMFVTWQQYDPTKFSYYKPSNSMHGQYTNWVGTNQIGTSMWSPAVALPDPSTVDPSSYPMGSDPMDDHGQPSLIADSSGFLHLFYGPHNQPLVETVSSSPWTASFPTAKLNPPSPGTTYSSVVRDPSGMFHMLYRNNATSGLAYVNGTPSSTGTTWNTPVPLVTIASGYAFYGGAIAVDQAGSLHVAFGVYPTVEPGNQDTWASTAWEYLRSDDRGGHWLYDNGNPATVPFNITPTVSYVPPTIHFVDSNKNADMRVSNIALDPSGWPWVSVLYLDNPNPSSYSLLNAPVRDTYLWHETAPGQWSKIGLSSWVTPGRALPCGRRRAASATVTFDVQGVLYVAVETVSPCDSSQYAWFSGVSKEVVLLVSSDLGQTFQIVPVIPPTTAQTPQWLANIERPTTSLLIPVPSLLYTGGFLNTSSWDGKPNKATDVLFTSFYKK